MDYDTRNFDFKVTDFEAVISSEKVDLSTAARRVSSDQVDLARLAPGDLLDNDLCSVPLLDATGLSDMLSGDLSLLAS